MGAIADRVLAAGLMGVEPLGIQGLADNPKPLTSMARVVGVGAACGRSASVAAALVGC
ncbi:MAG: hypothetical protein M3300_08860 [Actinomycetota bacterium]|jgi:hypothetical protein|nr:hypothetical protein [Actinomycetota bacterium]